MELCQSNPGCNSTIARSASVRMQAEREKRRERVRREGRERTGTMTGGRQTNGTNSFFSVACADPTRTMRKERKEIRSHCGKSISRAKGKGKIVFLSSSCLEDIITSLYPFHSFPSFPFFHYTHCAPFHITPLCILIRPCRTLDNRHPFPSYPTAVNLTMIRLRKCLGIMELKTGKFCKPWPSLRLPTDDSATSFPGE